MAKREESVEDRLEALGISEQCSTLVGKAARLALAIILDEQELEAKKANPVELPVLGNNANGCT